MTTAHAADDEKLGPIGPLPSVWEREARNIILSAFRAATEDATAAAALAAADLATSVHDFRKALRRAGAMVALVRPGLRKREFAAIRAELRAARRGVSAARDHTVAAETLAVLELSPAEREVAEVLLGILRAHEPVAAELSAHMAQGAERARAQVGALEAALADELEWKVVARGSAHTYDEAREARKRAKRSTAAFHRWRRRTKEVEAQLMLIAAHGGACAAALHVEYDGLSSQLGPIADLLMLRELIEAHGKASERAGLALLGDGIDRLAKEKIGEARAAGKPLFEASSSRFAKKLTRAIRQDAAPPTPPVQGDGASRRED